MIALSLYDVAVGPTIGIAVALTVAAIAFIALIVLGIFAFLHGKKKKAAKDKKEEKKDSDAGDPH